MNRLGSTVARLKLKGIDGDSHKRWSMWFNSMVNEAPHQGLKLNRRYAERCIFLVFNQDGWAGAARLSSARGLSCSLKWVNERNPYPVLHVVTGDRPHTNFGSMS